MLSVTSCCLPFLFIYQSALLTLGYEPAEITLTFVVTAAVFIGPALAFVGTR